MSTPAVTVLESKENTDYLNKDLDPNFNPNKLHPELRNYWKMINPYDRALARELFQFPEGKLSQEFVQRLTGALQKAATQMQMGQAEALRQAEEGVMPERYRLYFVPELVHECAKYLQHPRIIYKLRNGLLSMDTAVKFLADHQHTDSRQDIIEAGLTQDELEIIVQNCKNGIPHSMRYICYDLLKQGYNFEQSFALTESQRFMVQDKIPLEYVLKHNTLFYTQGTISMLRFDKDELFALQTLEKLSQYAKPDPSWEKEANRKNRQDKNQIPADILDFLRSPRARILVDNGTFSLEEVCEELSSQQVLPNFLLTHPLVYCLVTRLGVLPRELIDGGWLDVLARKPIPSAAVARATVKPAAPENSGDNKDRKDQVAQQSADNLLLLFNKRLQDIQALTALNAVYSPQVAGNGSAVTTSVVTAPAADPVVPGTAPPKI